jgi:diguanylate cyclase (GGDEF)-like protein/PAS domain S-box-containing protein
MPSISGSGIVPFPQTAAPPSTARRPNTVRILFVSPFLVDVDRCLQELNRVQFTVISDVALSLEQFTERLRSETFDLIVAEYPGTSWQDAHLLDALGKMRDDIPLILLVHDLKRESAADLMLKGVADCVDTNHMGHLPVAVHRVLREKTLREQRDRAEKELRRSEAHYRALAGNLSYGICRCDVDGNFLEVNETMVTMLGYQSKEDLLALDLAKNAIQDPDQRAQLLGLVKDGSEFDPLEMEWKRKNHAALKVRLSGRTVLSEQGELEAFEVIVENITRQRQLEDHLRRQAASDSLTGLANYRHLVDILDSEIKRSQRTGRKFAIVFFDLDRLKKINDRYGHMIGSQALCRFADVLSCNCRDIDTPARFGGDEFALVLPETNLEAATLVAERICDAIAKEDKGPNISVSAGLAIYPEHGDSIESLLRRADSALYCMKHLKTSEAKSRQSSPGS